MKRQFSIRNSLGEVVDLNGSVFFSTPTGLGYQLGPKYSDFKHGFFRDVDATSEPQQSVVGDVVFVGSDPYGQYNTFVTWINGSAGLEVVYQPKEIPYYRKVELTSISKGERERSGILRCPIVLKCLTPWYKNTPIVFKINEETSGNISRYDKEYDYRYLAASTNQAVEVNTVGQMDASYVVEITGLFVNPTIAVNNAATGEEYGKAIISCTVESGHKLVLSTQPDNAYVSLDGVDIINDVDITHNAFPRIPMGIPCLLSIAGDTSLTSGAVVRQYDYYRSV